METALAAPEEKQAERVPPASRRLPAEGFVRQSTLIPHIVPFSPATPWRKVKTKDFPAPVMLSARITAWRVQDIREWLQRQQ